MPCPSDICDEAFEREEWERELALKNRKPPEPPSPVCQNECGEKSQPGTNIARRSAGKMQRNWRGQRGNGELLDEIII